MAKKGDPRAVGRKGGFKSLGSHLPHNAYKGKIEKIKQGLIHNAKVKRAYYRTLKREEKIGNLASKTMISESQEQTLEDADWSSLHPSRSQALSRADGEGEDKRIADTPKLKDTRKSRKESFGKPGARDQLALAEARRKEAADNEKERQKKNRQREMKRKQLRKMTSKGQPVMKPRIENLLSKVKKVMKEG